MFIYGCKIVDRMIKYGIILEQLVH